MAALEKVMSDSSSDGRFGPPDTLFLTGVCLVAVAGVLPLISASQTVLDVDGSLQSSILGVETLEWYLLFGISVLGGLVVVFRQWDWVTVGVGGSSGLVVTGLALVYVGYPTLGVDYHGPAEPTLDPGIGLFAIVVGGALQLFGTYRGYQRPTRSGPILRLQRRSQSSPPTERDLPGNPEGTQGSTQTATRPTDSGSGQGRNSPDRSITDRDGLPEDKRRSLQSENPDTHSDAEERTRIAKDRTVRGKSGDAGRDGEESRG